MPYDLRTQVNSPPTQTRLVGRVKNWNDERGFGFLEPARDGPDVFVHIKAFPAGTGRPSVGQIVTYEVETGKNGKLRACEVRYHGADSEARNRRIEQPAEWTLPRALAIPLFAALYAYLSWQFGFWPMILGVYVVASAVAVLVYLFDKSAAVSGQDRIPEEAMHLLSLVGGWPGALLAQQFLRHKTSKASFQSEFWFAVLLNVAVMVAWHVGLIPQPR